MATPAARTSRAVVRRVRTAFRGWRAGWVPRCWRGWCCAAPPPWAGWGGVRGLGRRGRLGVHGDDSGKCRSGIWRVGRGGPAGFADACVQPGQRGAAGGVGCAFGGECCAPGGAGEAAHLLIGLVGGVGAVGEGAGELAGDEDLGGDAGLLRVGRLGGGDFLDQAGEAGESPGFWDIGRGRGDGGAGGGEEVAAEVVGWRDAADDFGGDAVGRDGHGISLLMKFEQFVI